MYLNEKYVFLLNNLKLGGVQKVIINLVNELNKQGYLIEIVLFNDARILEDQLDNGINVLCLYSKNHIQSFFLLRKYLLENKINTLFSNLFIPNIISILAAKSIKKHHKIVLGIHNTPSMEYHPFVEKFIQWVSLKFLYPLSDSVHICSNGSAEDLRTFTGNKFANLKVVYNPVISRDIDSLSKAKNYHPWFNEKNNMVLVGLGRLTKQKNFNLLIKAVYELKKDLNIKLLIMGEGEERQKLENLIRKKDLTDNVNLMGFVTNPYSYLKNCNIFVLSSEYEGLPTVLIEALHLGCQVVSTDCLSGPKEILQNGKYGELIPVGDLEAMISAIKRVLTKGYPPVDENWRNLFTVDTTVAFYKNNYFI